MPYRKDVEELPGGDRYAPKRQKPRQPMFSSDGRLWMIWFTVFMAGMCCFPVGLIVAGVVWRGSKNPTVRGPARLAVLIALAGGLFLAGRALVLR